MTSPRPFPPLVIALLVSTFAALATIAATRPAAAQLAIWARPMNSASVVPTNPSTADGLAIVTIDLELFTMRVEVRYAGLSSSSTSAHLHCCSLPGTNSIVAIQSPAFVGFPLGVLSGTYDHTFDLSLTSTWNPAFLVPRGGSVAIAINDLLIALDLGRGYVDVHSISFTSGEIRALLVAVPEPRMEGALVAGLVGIAVAGRTITRARRAQSGR